MMPRYSVAGCKGFLPPKNAHTVILSHTASSSVFISICVAPCWMRRRYKACQISCAVDKCKPVGRPFCLRRQIRSILRAVLSTLHPLYFLFPILELFHVRFIELLQCRQDFSKSLWVGR